jgi:hypothetical protein
MTSINADLSSKDVLDRLYDSGKQLQEWGKAIDGMPLLSARMGGDKQPAILIAAGSHATETAGVHAALTMLERLETEHEVHILPLRDPFGFAGAQHCLSFAARRPVTVSSHQDVVEYLGANATKLWQQERVSIFSLGGIGFVWNECKAGLDSFWDMFVAVGDLANQRPDILHPLRGQSIMLLNPSMDVEGAGENQRCWHGYLSANGGWLHLNRMLGSADAAPEVAALNALMQTIRPGLTNDLHEGNGSGFWLPIVKPKENPERVFRMAKAFLDYVTMSGYPVTGFEEWLTTDRTPQTIVEPDWMKPEPRLPGLFWMDTLKKGEGHNLSTYADLYGTAFGTESPMVAPLEMRVDGITNGILAAIKVWEENDIVN